MIGLKAPGSGTELDTLADNTGGSVQPLSSDGMNIGSAIIAGLGNLKIDVGMATNCTDPITSSSSPRPERHVRRRRPSSPRPSASQPTRPGQDGRMRRLGDDQRRCR